MTNRRLLSRLADPFSTRAALGLRPLTAPVIVFIPLGALLGPSGLAVLSQDALSHLDAVVSVALATLGVFIGIAGGRLRRQALRLFAASTVEAIVTILIVAGATSMLARQWQIPLAIPPWLLGLALGISAAASAAPAAGASNDPARQVASRVADLDDVLPILIGGVVLSLAGPAAPWAFQRALETALLGIGVGGAGWLLFERSEGAERGVFVLGALVLLGGTAAYLSLSPLLTGLGAGWFWAVSSGQTDSVVTNELAKVQHPLVVLLLLVAGASLKWSIAGLWLFAAYVLFRFAGKLSGGWAASRIAPGVANPDLGAYLIAPGVIGIAFALNLQQVAPEAIGPLVFAVSVGAIACELLALFVTPPLRSA